MKTRVKKIKSRKKSLKKGNQDLSRQDLKSAPCQAKNRTVLKCSLSQWSSHRQETLLAVVESSSGTFWNPASSIWANHDAGSSRSHDTAAKTRGGVKERKERGEKQWDKSREMSHRNWLRPHTQIKHNFVISNSLNMQKPQVKTTHFCPSNSRHPRGGCTLRITFIYLC